MKLHVLGIDLGKTVFHLVGLDSTGKAVIRKRCSRTQLLAFTANLQVELIGMEACSGSHFLTEEQLDLQEYIGADQLPSFVFRLQRCGGPYIPVSRLSGPIRRKDGLRRTKGC
jgi:hypothetical protein